MGWSKCFFPTNSIEKNQDEPYQILEYHIFRQIQMFKHVQIEKSCDFVAMDVGRDFMSMCLTLQIGGPIICFSCRALHSSASPAGKKTKVVAMPLPMTDAEVISRLQSSTKMQNKADFVKSVLQQTGMALEFVNPKFQKDPQMAKLAVENNAMALQFVSVQCKGLDQIALTAVKKNVWPCSLSLPRSARSTSCWQL